VARKVVNYDALIVGIAAFHGASVLVSLDQGMKKMGALAGVRVVEPNALLSGQQREIVFRK
jgi:predicted nucleic acid-binding protein